MVDTKVNWVLYNYPKHSAPVTSACTGNKY